MVTFPLEFPLTNFTVFRFNLRRSSVFATKSNLEYQSAELSPPRWAITELETAPNNAEDFEAWNCFNMLLRDGQNRFLGYDHKRKYPLAYINSGIPATRADASPFDGTAKISTAVSNGFDVILKNLPSNYIVSRGDYIGWTVNGVYGLHKVMALAAANNSGVVTVTVEPRISVPAPVDTVVNLIKPKCLMTILPDTWDENESEVAYSSIGFKAIQVRS